MKSCYWHWLFASDFLFWLIQPKDSRLHHQLLSVQKGCFQMLETSMMEEKLAWNTHIPRHGISCLKKKKKKKIKKSQTIKRHQFTNRPIFVPSLVKISLTVFVFCSGNETWRTDGRTEGQKDGRTEGRTSAPIPISPCHFVAGGIINWLMRESIQPQERGEMLLFRAILLNFAKRARAIKGNFAVHTNTNVDRSQLFCCWLLLPMS